MRRRDYAQFDLWKRIFICTVADRQRYLNALKFCRSKKAVLMGVNHDFLKVRLGEGLR